MHGWHKKFVETESVLQQTVSRHMSTNDGMWNRSEKHFCLVYRNTQSVAEKPQGFQNEIAQ